MTGSTGVAALPPAGAVAVVLAGGAGTRFTGPTHKLLAPLPSGTTLVRHAIDVALAAGFTRVLLVLGDLGATAVGHLPPEVEVLANPQWAEGLATSLAVAVDRAEVAGATSVVVGLADQPGLTVAAWQAVAAPGPTPLAAASYDGGRGHPVRLDRGTWPYLPATGDRGAGQLLAARPDLVTEVPCPGDPADVDTVADLAAWVAAHPA